MDNQRAVSPASHSARVSELHCCRRAVISCWQLRDSSGKCCLERFPAELNRKGIPEIEGNLIDDLRRLEAARDGSVVFGFTQEGDFGGH